MVSFGLAGEFQGVSGDGISDLANPTTLQFGPDGRLYVGEQSGRISAFTIAVQGDAFVATSHEVLTLPNGGGVVQSIMNHNDSGANLPGLLNRQVTGILVAGTAANPVLYVSSSDPRIASNGEVNLDTNSGTLTQVTWNGSQWVAVDLIRGLPRSEENHANNGMALSADGNTLYLTVGGNTNNGAPSSFFSYTGEYALSGSILEIDLAALQALPVLTDSDGGKVNGTAVARQYVYDLPTLDDPNIPNVTDGVGEDAAGLDEAGPFGGNDGLNMAILPADAPIKIYADGFRNPYDLVLKSDGKLFTVDNGSNGGLGGNPLDINGTPTDQSGLPATNTPNNGGTGNGEPLFLIQPGGYYGHPNPARSNQDLAWTVYNDSGNPDNAVGTNSVGNLSSLVPAGVNIQSGFLIDPSKFTGDPNRLLESGIRVPYNSSNSPSIVNIASSSNGLVEYTADAFDGALKGALLVAQFNSNLKLLNINDAGTALEPLIGPGPDGQLGTADDEVIDADGNYDLITGFSTPLDVTIGPGGSIWVAEIGGDFIKAYVPGGSDLNEDDFDLDGLLNTVDPFIRDAANGKGAVLTPGQTLVWDFDPNQDGNLPGPNGYGGGLTGVMINGSIDYEAFFQEPSTLPDQDVNLDNVKFITAAGGGTTVIENVSNGDAFGTTNNGEYLFHTGLQIDPTVDAFTIKWSVINPLLSGSFQQIGGYLGTGDQSNYLKFVATDNPSGEIQLVLENKDSLVAESFIQADDLFSVPPDQQIFFELTIDPSTGVAAPKVTYQTGGGGSKTVTGTPISLSGTNVLSAILGNYTVQGQSTGLAVGLYSSNTGQPPAPSGSFQAVFTDIEITAAGSSSGVLYRVNAGGPEIAAIDGGPNWSADPGSAPSSYLTGGGNGVASFTAVEPGSGVPTTTPGAIFDTERFDAPAQPEMTWAFDVPQPGLYQVNLYMGNGFSGTSAPGQRVFDVAIEGTVLENLDNIDLASRFGHLVGGVVSNTVQVDDGVLNIEFLHDQIENPLINGIEIIQLASEPEAVVFNFLQYVQFQLLDEGIPYMGPSLDLEVGGVNLAAIYDETYYLSENPDVAAAVESGTFNYGFVHFVNFGLEEGRNPSLYYDEETYLLGSADVLDAINAGAFTSGLSHYLQFGHKESRTASTFFDPIDYVNMNPDVAAAIQSGAVMSGFEHYVEFGAKEGRKSMLLFEEAFYLQQNSDVATAVAAGQFESGFDHYVLFGQADGRDPGPLFDESAYLDANPDVAGAVASGILSSGMEHFFRFGRAEGRLNFPV